MARTRVMVCAAMGLALAVLAQSLRFFLPLPSGPLSQLVIGGLVNLALVLTVRFSGSPWTASVGFFLPLVAFLQGQLPLLPMVPVVGIGNTVFAALAGAILWKSRFVWLAPFVKAALLYGGTQLVFCAIDLPEPALSALSMAMGAPQIVTGLVGVALAKIVARRAGR